MVASIDEGSRPLEERDRPSAETLNKVLWTIPNVLCLIGSRSGDEWNAMTQSWVTQVAMEPVSFSVNLWDREDTRPFVKFSKPATRDGMSLNGRVFREGVTGVPIFEEAVAFLECSVWQTIDCGTHDLFLGEVVDAAFREDVEDPLVARMEDTRMKYGGVKRGGH